MPANSLTVGIVDSGKYEFRDPAVGVVRGLGCTWAAGGADRSKTDAAEADVLDGGRASRRPAYARRSPTERSASRPGGEAEAMIIEHRGRRPTIDPSAYVAPNATVCGDVHVGSGARILFGAVLTAEDGRVDVGARTVVMEHALVRGRERSPARLGDDVLVGPHAHVNGAVVEDGAFLATGAAIFPGAVVGSGSEVRIHGVVHVNSVLAPATTVPIGWIAVGDPAQLFSPDRHDELWAVQERLDFPGTVYGISREASPHERMTRQSAWFGAHRDDRLL